MTAPNTNNGEGYETSELIPIHLGLMGHIDAGKTAIARALSEVISTAGLDKHSQSQKRGITIDLGFTFFKLNKFMITIVDAPGHADLIKSVVSGANIIDIAFLVIDAKQGPQIQTGEHLIILDLLKIPVLGIIVNKIDIVDQNQIDKVHNQLHTIVNATSYKNKYQIFDVSAEKNLGFENIKSYLENLLENRQFERNKEPPMQFLFDHHFHKQGIGTVMTGTVISGKAKIGDTLTILPTNIKTKIKSIQKWKTSVKEMKAGDRCGISVMDITPNQIYRGCFATNDPTKFLKAEILDVEVEKTPLFKLGFKFGQQITINHAMMTVNGRIFPYRKIIQGKDELYSKYTPGVSQNHFHAIIWLESIEYIKIGDPLLISRLDLPPKTLRIAGIAKIGKVIQKPVLFSKEKVKKGSVKNPDYRNMSVLVNGLAQSDIGAKTILGLYATPPYSKILSTFGKKGIVEVALIQKKDGNGFVDTPNALDGNIKEKIQAGSPVELKIYKKFELDYLKSYK